MKCNFLIPKIQPHKTCYISEIDYDTNLGGHFQIAIHPFPCSENENAAFYYVMAQPGGKILIEGEGYILTEPAKVSQHRSMGRREFGRKEIWYYWLDSNGNIIKKERM